MYKVFETRNNPEYVAAQSQQEAVDKYAEEFIDSNDEEEAKKVLSVEFVGVVYV